MTNYPVSQDNIITLPGVSGSSQEDVAINALRDATFAIEKELGVTPSGVYTDVRARLDILENRLSGFVSPVILGDGYVNSPLYIVNPFAPITLSISDGIGAPTENRIDGSLYMRGGDGYANNQLYIRLGATWHPVQTEQFTAANDLAPFLSVPGNPDGHLAQTVIGLYNHPISSSLNTIDGYSDGYHLTWDQTDGYWRAETGFVANGDLAPNSAERSGLPLRFGRTKQTVTGIQNKSIAPAVGTPADGDILVWEATDGHWDVHQRAVIFGGSAAAGDGYVTRTNIRSNRLLQSPSLNNAGKIGMTNFGNRSTGASTGTTDNYAAILSGDRGSASGTYSLIAAGDVNISSGQFSAIVDGYINTSSGQYSLVGNGTNNLAGANFAMVLDGYNNTADGLNSYVLDGYNNAAHATYSGVLNGTSNIISAGNTHAGIGFGASNTITGASATFSVILGGSGNTTNAQNVFLGTPTGANVQSNYGLVGTGITNTIGTTSSHSAIISGTNNAISNSSGFSFIGAGNNITTVGLYATVLNATVAIANGLHTLVLNGNTNNIVGSFSTIGNGNNNSISGNPAYATILDGYSNTVTGSGGLIVDGYSNTVNGIWSSVINGNNNSISGANATVLNGSSNTIDVASPFNAILFGTSNSLTTSTRVVVAGNGNTFTNVTNAYVLGQFNNVQGSSTKVTGDSNTIGAGSNFNRVFGNTNNLGANSIQNSVFGANNNLINSTHDNIILGSTNIVDGAGSSVVLGMSNIANSNFGFVQGQFGKSRMYGQHVHANGRFTPGKIGEAQWSRVVLDGYAVSGGQILLQLQDLTQALPTNPFFQDGYSYDMQIRVLVVNTSPIGPNPTAPGRYVFDVLAHQEATTIAVASNGQTLPQATINVLATAGFPPIGAINVTTSSGVQVVNYTGITGTTFTGCTGGVGTMSTGGLVNALVLDNVNQTLITPQFSGTPWTVTIGTSSARLTISVDTEVGPPYVQPTNTPSDRRAVATIEMREMSRL